MSSLSLSGVFISLSRRIRGINYCKVLYTVPLTVVVWICEVDRRGWKREIHLVASDSARHVRRMRFDQAERSSTPAIEGPEVVCTAACGHGFSYCRVLTRASLTRYTRCSTTKGKLGLGSLMYFAVVAYKLGRPESSPSFK